MTTAKAGESRVWIVRGVGSNGTVEYYGCAKANDPSWALGGIAKAECPDPETANEFITTAEWREASERASTGLQMRYQDDLSQLLALAREKCDFDMHVLWGACRAKNSYLPPNWSHIDAYPFAAIEQWSAENYGALSSDDQNVVNESSDITAREMYQYGRVLFSELLKTTIAREIIAVDVCDSPSCGGDCGEWSGGCGKVFAVQLGTGATPGTLPSVVYVSFKRSGAIDKSGSTNIDTMFSNETPTDGKCMGQWFIVPSSSSNSIHYAKSADILKASETWYEQITGFVAGGEPQALYVADATHAWLVGNAGYIYFFDNPETAVQVQDAGVATTQVLNDVHGCDASNVVAVGQNNAVVYTTDGGQTWASVTGPAAGIGLNAIWVYSPNVWFVGCANGKLYDTQNAGVSWTEITLPGSLDQIYDIQATMDGAEFVLTGTSGGTAKILRSTARGIAGTWYVMPEADGSVIPTADRINQIALCPRHPNTIYAGGLAADGSDGILMQGKA